MGVWMLGGVTLAYLVTAVELAVKGRPAMALFCAGCAIANAGLIGELT